MSITFYIVRHGQSEGNVNGDVMGDNPPLTSTGIDQAKALSSLLKSIKIDQIFSSDLTRAKQTAQIIAQSKNLEIVEYKQIKERSFGRLEGQKGTEVSKNHQEKIDQFNQIPLADQMEWKIVEDMESLNEVLRRVLPFFDTITETNEDQTVLVVTHANVILSLLAHFGFIKSFRELPFGSIQNTAYVKIEKSTDGTKITEVFGIKKTEIKF